MITASSFRNKFLRSLTINYDWITSEHYAEIYVEDHSGITESFRISGLSGYNVNEDFMAMYIEQCTLLETVGRIYLSLDPFEEGAASEKDNYSFTGSAIGVSS
jgi:hypothetical protein